ncbi:MAG: hypothetical protein WB245_12930 [Acidimicrobiia bacterium]|jgi:hypothetical protein
MLDFVLGYGMGQRTASRAAMLARSAAAADGTIHTNRIEDLNERIDRMLMIVRGMWALMEEQGLTADQLIAKMNELDTKDGEVDGLMRPQPRDCRSCGSKVAAGLDACQFCGARVTNDDSDPIGQI